MILLNDDERRQWETAVATWPTCQTCGGSGERVTAVNPGAIIGPCPSCVAGRVPQPVYIVIEGERVRDRALDAYLTPDSKPIPGWSCVVPARWRVPVGESCEIRAECPDCACRVMPPCYADCPGSVLLASAATVEVLPVVERASVDWSATPMVTVNTPTGAVRRWWDESGSYEELTLDPLPVPGRHFVAVVTP